MKHAPWAGRFLAALMARASRNGTAAVAVGTRPTCGLSFSAGFLRVHARPKGFEMGRRWRRVDLAEKKVARKD